MAVLGFEVDRYCISIDGDNAEVFELVNGKRGKALGTFTIPVPEQQIRFPRSETPLSMVFKMWERRNPEDQELFQRLTGTWKNA
jgi:hypothetical protein